MKWTKGEPVDLNGAYALQNTATGATAFATYNYPAANWTFAGYSDGSQAAAVGCGMWPDEWEHTNAYDIADQPEKPAPRARLSDVHGKIRAAMAAKVRPDMSADECQQVLLLAKALAALSGC